MGEPMKTCAETVISNSMIHNYSFRRTWLPARMAGISGGGFRPQLHIQLFFSQSRWGQHCRQCWKFAPCDTWRPGGPRGCAKWNRREDEQTHRIPLHQVRVAPLVKLYCWSDALAYKCSSRCVCEVHVFVVHTVCAQFKCLCNMYVVLLVVGIQCLEYCFVIAQSVRAAVGARGHHAKEPQLQEHGAALQLSTPCYLCLQGVEIRCETDHVNARCQKYQGSLPTRIHV